MKLRNIRDVDKFFEMINMCEGNVYLTSKDGDRINLKSTLCQYVAREVFTGVVDELEINADRPKDAAKILGYMMWNN